MLCIWKINFLNLKKNQCFEFEKNQCFEFEKFFFEKINVLEIEFFFEFERKSETRKKCWWRPRFCFWIFQIQSIHCFTLVNMQKVVKTPKYRRKSKSMWFGEKTLFVGGFFFYRFSGGWPILGPWFIRSSFITFFSPCRLVFISVQAKTFHFPNNVLISKVLKKWCEKHKNWQESIRIDNYLTIIDDNWWNVFMKKFSNVLLYGSILL